MHDKLITKRDFNLSKINTIYTKVSSTGRLVFKTQYNSNEQNPAKKIEGINKKIPNTSGLFKKTDYNTWLQYWTTVIGLVSTTALKTINFDEKMTEAMKRFTNKIK